MPAGFEKFRRARRIRLFHKARNALDAFAAWQGIACFDIAIADLGRGRLHAESHNRPRPRRCSGLGKSRLQRRHIANRRIGGHEPQHRAGGGFLSEQRRSRNGGRAIAAHWFQHDGCALIAQLLSDQEAMRFIANNHRRQEASARTPRGGFRQHGLVGSERPELLRVAFARQRPKPRAGATGQDHRQDRGGIGVHGQ